jgi:hypothetical protein
MRKYFSPGRINAFLKCANSGERVVTFWSEKGSKRPIIHLIITSPAPQLLHKSALFGFVAMKNVKNSYYPLPLKNFVVLYNLLTD